MMTIATVISRVFEPMIVFAGIALLGALYAGLSGWSLILFFIILAVVMVGPIFAMRAWMLRQGHIKDWDIHARKQRVRPLLGLICVVFIDVLIISFWNNAVLSSIFVVFLLWLTGFFLITLWFKISGHVGAIAMATGLLVLWYGQTAWACLLLVPLVAWARIVRRDHTPVQTIAGALYSWSMIALLSGYLVVR
jgi:hypothetical protein